MQVLEREKEGAYTVYFRAKQSNVESPPFGMGKIGGYLIVPFEIKEGKLRITFLGNLVQVKRFLHRTEIMRVRHKIVSLTDAKLLPRVSLKPPYRKAEKNLDCSVQAGIL